MYALLFMKTIQMAYRRTEHALI